MEDRRKQIPITCTESNLAQESLQKSQTHFSFALKCVLIGAAHWAISRWHLARPIWSIVGSKGPRRGATTSKMQNHIIFGMGNEGSQGPRRGATTSKVPNYIIFPRGPPHWYYADATPPAAAQLSISSVPGAPPE